MKKYKISASYHGSHTFEVEALDESMAIYLTSLEMQYSFNAEENVEFPDIEQIED